MDAEYRSMEKGDIKEIMAIEDASFPAPWAEHAFQGELKNDFAFYYVAVYEGKVIGYCGMWLFSGEAHVTTIAVHPDWRGQGLGRMSMNILIENAKNQGATAMLLEVRPSNSNARTLYKNLGFRQIGCRKNYYPETHEDALVMIRNLLPESTGSRIARTE